jgi:hypothetical protein
LDLIAPKAQTLLSATPSSGLVDGVVEQPPPPIRARPASIDRVALPAVAIVFAILFWLYGNPKTRVPGT